jgi:Bacteriophage probable baseplate hub protein
VSATRESGLPETYYAPEFSVEIEGTALEPASKGDVVELKVELDLQELDSAEIKLNNYDDTAFDLKWSDSDQFQLGNRVHVQMGYADRLVSMMRGPITTLSPDFPADGVPTLTVRALDGLVRLKGSKPPEGEVTYERKSDWQIAQLIAERHQLPVEVTEQGPEHPLVVQRNMDDAVFLKERAARIDFDVYMRTDPDTGEDVLNFVAPTDERSAEPIRTYVLAWGSLRNTSAPPSLIEFKPTITAANQVQSVTVRGWDPVAKEAVTHTATPDTTPGVSGSGDATGPASAGRISGGDGRQEVVVDAPVASVEEAQRLAEALLAERAYEFLTGHGKAIGLPDLRPGDNVEIVGLGERFSGMHFVTKVTHTLDSSGLLTEFDVRKTYEGEIP